MPSALLIYYSFTGEARRVVERATETLHAAGYQVGHGRIDFADPTLRLGRPLSPGTVKRWTEAAEKGRTEPVVIAPPDALADRYDLICLVSNTWQHHPCVPIRSVLQRPDLRALLKGTPFAVYVVCRRSWERNLDIVRREAEACGGRFIGGERFEHAGSDLGSLLRTVSYLMTTGGRVARLMGLRLPLPDYGLSDAAVERVTTFTRSIAGLT